jgi:uncharacterized membrane protein
MIASWRTFSFVGLAAGALFLAASLSPSLMPRPFLVQGLLSGFALAMGYGLGVFLVWSWLFLEIPQPRESVQRISKRVTVVVVAVVLATFLWRATVWQNSIRERMEMEPVASMYPIHVGLLALLTGFVLVMFGRATLAIGRQLHRWLHRVLPRRVSYFVSGVLTVLLVVLLANQLLARIALNLADRVFLEMDRVIDENIAQPTDAGACGSEQSLVEWDSLGRFGKQFLVDGPTETSISALLGTPSKQPVRVYVGMAARGSMQERAELALDELKRTGGFQRSLLVIATPTGTGWLDPGGVDTIECMHRGDTAIVSMQYSYLPSWITILVDPTRSRESARALFEAVYSHWKTLPKEERPKLYLFGLSLGALGSSASADLLDIFEDPINGGLWSGPPFPSRHWAQATAKRFPDSPMWLPKYRNGSLLRFTGRENTIAQQADRWGPMRFIYLQHASDPMTFFSPTLLYRKPEWIVGQRGPDVSPYLGWYPIVTFLQIAFDLPLATSTPFGYGHNYHPSSYIDCWEAITEPQNWSSADSERLKSEFAR